MSFVKTLVTIANPRDPSRSVRLRAVVNPSFLRTCVPDSVAERLGLELGPRVRVVEPTSGRVCEFPESEAVVGVRGRSASIRVLVSSDEPEPIIGSDVLEKLRLRVSPAGGVLVDVG